MKIESVLLIDLGNVWGGQEIYSANLMSCLREHGYQVISLSTKQRHADFADIHYLVSGHYLSFSSLNNKINQIVSEYNVDVVHVNGNRAMYLSWLFKLPVRIVATKHLPFFVGDRKPFKHRIARIFSTLLFSRIDHIICVAKATHADLPVRYKSNSSVIENGVPDRALGVDLPIYNGELRLCYVARLVEDKGILGLMNGVVKASQNGLSCHLTIAGDGPLKEQVMKIASDHSDLFEFHGFVEDTTFVYENSGVCCLPSRNEGLPLNILEAFSFGLPVIAMGIPSLLEVVTTQNGWIINDNDSNAIENILKSIMAQKEQLPKKSQAARQCYEEKYSLKLMVENTLRVYNDQ